MIDEQHVERLAELLWEKVGSGPVKNSLAFYEVARQLLETEEVWLVTPEDRENIRECLDTRAFGSV